MELYKKYRPTTFNEIIGQDDAIRMLVEMGRRKAIPHTLLFTGPSGCGKTTFMRILRRKLKCGDRDYHEVNAADDRGIDIVRDFKRRSCLAPIDGPCRIWSIDECANMTPQAQESFLKLLEDTPEHVYFFLATTDPQRLKKTIITRCTEIKVRSLTNSEMQTLITSVVKKEQKQIEEDVVEKIVDVAEGSARKGLVLLHQVIDLESEEEKLDVLQKADVKQQAFDIGRLLLNPKTTWKEMATLLKQVDEDPETIRWMILAYMTTVALGAKGNARRAVQVIEAFMEPFYDSKKAGLVQAAYVVIAR